MEGQGLIAASGKVWSENRKFAMTFMKEMGLTSLEAEGVNVLAGQMVGLFFK